MLTCTMVVTGRISPNTSPWALPAASQAEMSVMKMRVRTTPDKEAPAWVRAEAILASGGDPVEAAVPLRQAHEVACALEAAPLRVAIQALASRARIRLDADPGIAVQESSRPPTTLTARELEVLALVAAGHTNREIGDRLFISEKTASVHVTHAMNKLGALSRYEAAATATRLGLLDPATAP